MNRYVQFLAGVASAFLMVTSAWGQSQQVTFRYLPSGDQSIVRAFVPGEFNNWGPNNNGVIATNASSIMVFDDTLSQWVKTIPLSVGSTYQYKIHVHFNEAGTDWQWITDPWNARVNTADNNNSVVTITDPMVFQAAREVNDNDLVSVVSASLSSTRGIASVQFWVNGIERDGLPYYNTESGVFRFQLPNPVRAGSQFKIKITDQDGGLDSLEVGEVQVPLSWNYPDFETVQDTYTLKANITRQDGTVDSTLTTAQISRRGSGFESVPVMNGTITVEEKLELGGNTYVLQAEIGGELFTSDTLRVTKKVHPLDTFILNPSAGGSGFAFSVNANPDSASTDVVVNWEFDEMNSTTELSSFNISGNNVNAVATGPGELYFDVVAERAGEVVDQQRVAVIAQENGIVRTMQYEETPSWVNNLVVYEIFPLSFGPLATGTPSMPGKRFDEITANLDYIANMGFNAIWFMPVMENQIMDPISGGYNITDFYNVDPTLGTNEDFKELVARAHELGIKIIMDITPNHSSPIHPWIDALREHGNEVPPGSFVQTTPSTHSRGLDGRGSNLPEVWQLSEGGNLYRKYEGFGDLANLDWDNDDLQAEFLTIIEHWIREFDIDGWRFDVYWGPWRRYGPDRFGRPIRELMKRIKPDSWILGEIAGTGVSTEVYFTDNDNGSSVVGGMDAGYDWIFYFDGVLGTYGNVSNYDARIRNGDFWPGPNARYFRFLENHDEERIARRLRENPDRILPLTGLILTSTGVPMIYQGQEVNFGNVSGDGRRVAVNWNTVRNGEFASYHQRLVHARTTFSAFRTQTQTTLTTSNGIYGFVRPELDENAVVLINFTASTQNVSIDPSNALLLSTDGPISYTDIFSDSSFVDQEIDGFNITIPAYETVVLIANGGEPVAFDLPAMPQLPYDAVYTANEKHSAVDIEGPAMLQNYPNPFNSKTTITYSIEATSYVSLNIYDLLGRQVKRIVNETQAPGTYQVEINMGDLSSGLYMYRLELGGESHVKRMVKIN